MIDITHMTSFLNEWTNTVFPPKKSSMRSVCQKFALFNNMVCTKQNRQKKHVLYATNINPEVNYIRKQQNTFLKEFFEINVSIYTMQSPSICNYDKFSAL